MRQSQQKSSAYSRLLKCLRILYGKQRGPRSDCSYRSSLFWVHTFCFYTLFVSSVRQLFAADDFSRRHFQMHFFLGALRVNPYPAYFCLLAYLMTYFCDLYCKHYGLRSDCSLRIILIRVHSVCYHDKLSLKCI